LCASTGAGKCWGRDTKILMHDGSIKNVQDIVAGDVVMSPNGEKRKVLKSISNISETDIKEMAEYITKITIECAEWGIDIPCCDNLYNY